MPKYFYLLCKNSIGLIKMLFYFIKPNNYKSVA